MFDFLTAVTASANPKDAITRANFAVQDKLGKFMSLGNRVIVLRDKAKTAEAIQKGNSLLNGIQTIQSRALLVLGEAKTLQEKLGSNLSLESVLKFSKDDAAQAGGIVTKLYAINADMDAQTRKVDEYASEMGLAPASERGNDLPPWIVVAATLGVLGLLAFSGKSK